MTKNQTGYKKSPVDRFNGGKKKFEYRPEILTDTNTATNI